MMNLCKGVLLIGCGLVAHQGKVWAQANEVPLAGKPYAPHPAQVVVTKVKHFDNMCWKIATAGGTWYFENGETAGKSGFNSAFDLAGNDWIGNDANKGYNTSPRTGGSHEYRGWPNFGEGNFDHPQRSSGASSRWVDAAGTTVPFVDTLRGDHLIMRSMNATYEIEYHFFASHAAIKVIKAGNKYAFLFEGPIGGEQEASVEKDYYVIKSGAKNTKWGSGLGYLDPAFGNKFPSPYFYLVDSDPKDNQVWYAGVKDVAPPTAGDEGWIQGTNMVIFSFGRDQDKRAYTGTAAVCVFGFHTKAPHATIDTFIEARLANPFVAAGTGPTGSIGAGAGLSPVSWDAGNLQVSGKLLRVKAVAGYEYSVHAADGSRVALQGKETDGWYEAAGLEKGIYFLKVFSLGQGRTTVSRKFLVK